MTDGGKMRTLAAIACVGLLAVLIVLVPQPAGAQEDIAPVISEKNDEPKWLRDWPASSTRVAVLPKKAEPPVA